MRLKVRVRCTVNIKLAPQKVDSKIILQSIQLFFFHHLYLRINQNLIESGQGRSKSVLEKIDSSIHPSRFLVTSILHEITKNIDMKNNMYFIILIQWLSTIEYTKQIFASPKPRVR